MTADRPATEPRPTTLDDLIRAARDWGIEEASQFSLPSTLAAHREEVEDIRAAIEAEAAQGGAPLRCPCPDHVGPENAHPLSEGAAPHHCDCTWRDNPNIWAAPPDLYDAARAILPEVIDAELPSAITSDDPMAGIERMMAMGDRWERLRAALSEGAAPRAEGLEREAAAATPSLQREVIESWSRLQDAYDALRAAILWLHGEYRDTDRSEFNAQAWYRKARSGSVGLRDFLARSEREAASVAPQERRD